ncbi:hypothetical protein G1H11_17650 [Phytoactinopolyspora alkaliphila]|uniref:Uncharacterized protein n=1 Tax=Phytoactinopolyspora alkaliphila TaxID=1783498 RepID=A0A6N9YPZ9_9ACTN|nr:hypothetical protein [Phytoactinopolyspora alkaliphila]NED97126.1 hypothetical protein [Phytoactinopolyspora alkaliphila]
MYGRDDREYADLLDETIRFLGERARLERDTSYTELRSVLARRTGYPPFDFGLDRDRAGMGQLLGDSVTRTYPEIGAMISSIVVYLNANDAGPGFYRLAERMGLLRPRSSRSTREAFWLRQVDQVFEYFHPGNKDRSASASDPAGE